MGWGFRRYVPIAARRRKSEREMERLRSRGRPVSPVLVGSRTIARSFWGLAWCRNLERYSDFSNRLPRGRTYVRNGSVVDLQVARGTVVARVSGSRLYTVRVAIEPVGRARWTALCRSCAGGIDSLVELLQARFSKAVMERICAEKTGLFPSPDEIRFSCTCPDWAAMCKHVAAVLYGVGARLDDRPELLFALRAVDGSDLIAHAGAGLTTSRALPAPRRALGEEGLSELFGIDLAVAAAAPVGPRRARTTKPGGRSARHGGVPVRRGRGSKPPRA
jgi:hypothetical protein